MLADGVWLVPLILLLANVLLLVPANHRLGQIRQEICEAMDPGKRHLQAMAPGVARRARHVKRAVSSLYVSLVLLFLGGSLGVAAPLWPGVLWIVGAVTLGALFLVAYSCLQLVRESRLCVEDVEESLGTPRPEETRF